MPERETYPSDLTNGQWKRIEPLLPEEVPWARPRKYGLREILNGILYVNRTGCAWRAMPHDLPKWQAVYSWFRLFRINGTWKRIHDQLRGDLRTASGRKREPSAGIVDSQSVKTTEKGGSVATTRGRRSRAARDTSS